MKKFGTRLHIIKTFEKLEGRMNLSARHGSRLTVSSLHVYIESEAKEVCWKTWRTPGVSLNFHDPLLRLTGIFQRQTGDPLFARFLMTAQDGGVGPIIPLGPARVQWGHWFFKNY